METPMPVHHDLVAPTMKTSSISRSSLLLIGLALLAVTAPAHAQQVSREQDIVELRLGQRIKVDDGTCPAGQVKEVSGAKMSSTGIVRARKCIPRLGVKSTKPDTK
jgi:hypothetical protein